MNKYLMRSPFKPVMKTARFKQPSYTVRTLFKSPTLRDATLQEVLKVVKRECDLCKSYPSSSALRSGTIASLKEMSWESIVEDLKQRAPVLLSILMAAGTSSRGGQTRIPAPCSVVMAAAVLLKARSRNMCKVQAMIGALLYAGHASKRVCEINAHLHLVTIIKQYCQYCYRCIPD